MADPKSAPKNSQTKSKVKSEHHDQITLNLKIHLNHHFLTFNESAFHSFTESVRNPQNCITNYVIRRKHVHTDWLCSKDEVIIPWQSMHSSGSLHEFSDDVYYLSYDESLNSDLDPSHDDYCIRIDFLNLAPSFYGLRCPFCDIQLQCIPLDDHQITFLCFSFPRCEYPLSFATPLVRDKLVWNNVIYVGPTTSAIHDHNEADGDGGACNNKSKEGEDEIESLLFDDKQKQRKLIKWKRYQRKKRKQLKKRLQLKWSTYEERKALLSKNRVILEKQMRFVRKLQLIGQIYKHGMLNKTKSTKSISKNATTNGCDSFAPFTLKNALHLQALLLGRKNKMKSMTKQKISMPVPVRPQRKQTETETIDIN